MKRPKRFVDRHGTYKSKGGSRVSLHTVRAPLSHLAAGNRVIYNVVFVGAEARLIAVYVVTSDLTTYHGVITRRRAQLKPA